jgi:hypothetical protein
MGKLYGLEKALRVEMVVLLIGQRIKGGLVRINFRNLGILADASLRATVQLTIFLDRSHSVKFTSNY